MAEFTCPKCGHTESSKQEIITQAQLLGLPRVAVGGPMNHRFEAVSCKRCGFVAELYYRGRVF